MHYAMRKLFMFRCFILFSFAIAYASKRMPKLIAGNWKMNPADLKTAVKLAFDVSQLTKSGYFYIVMLYYYNLRKECEQWIQKLLKLR